MDLSNMIKDYEEKDIKPSEDDSTDYMSPWTLIAIKFTQLELEFQRIVDEALKQLVEYKENEKMNLKDYLKDKKEKEANAKKRNRKRQSHKRRINK